MPVLRLRLQIFFAEAGAGASTMTYTGKLQDDGSLAGTLKTPSGEMNWTATRVKK